MNVNSLKNLTHRFPKGNKINKGRKNALGYKHTKEAREKISLSHMGEKNPMKRPEVKEKMRLSKLRPDIPKEYSLDWTKTLRRCIRERDRYVCKVCGEIQTDKIFDIHHIDYDKKNCNPNNLITLCRKCHMKTNYNRDYWANYFNNLMGVNKII